MVLYTIARVLYNSKGSVQEQGYSTRARVPVYNLHIVQWDQQSVGPKFSQAPNTQQFQAMSKSWSAKSIHKKCFYKLFFPLASVAFLILKDKRREFLRKGQGHKDS